MSSTNEKDIIERLDGSVDNRADLDKLDTLLRSLKVEYEQHFLGIRPLAPDKLHQEVKGLIRKLRKAPFKTPSLNYRLKTLEGRYQTFHTYWARVLRERENGTYSRDVFKAELHERLAREEEEAQTAKGQAKRHIESLYQTYKSAIEKQAGKAVEIDYNSFKKSLVQRAKDIKSQHGVKKLTFKVVVQDGKVLVKAVAKE